jgi:molybdenum cofactor guanylyltransferase
VASRRLTGALLVGGASTRFGSPKALAELDGETLAERAWRLLGQLCDERLGVGKRRDALGVPFPLVDDGTDVRAPLAGVVAALRAATNEIVLVVPVDLPLLLAEDLRALAAACRDAAVPQTGPLPGAYAKTALPRLERALEAGELKLHEVLRELDVAVVTIDAARLENVNHIEDLERLRGVSSTMGA